GDGRMTGLITRLLEVARRQNRVGPLTREIEQTLARHPTWGTGKALKAVMDAQSGRVDAARQALAELIEGKKNPMPPVTRFLVGQELEDYSSLRELVMKCYEGGVDDLIKEGNYADVSDSPIRRLVRLYQQDDRAADARALVLKCATGNAYEYDASYSAY